MSGHWIYNVNLTLSDYFYVICNYLQIIFFFLFQWFFYVIIRLFEVTEREVCFVVKRSFYIDASFFYCSL